MPLMHCKCSCQRVFLDAAEKQFVLLNAPVFSNNCCISCIAPPAFSCVFYIPLHAAPYSCQPCRRLLDAHGRPTMPSVVRCGVAKAIHHRVQPVFLDTLAAQKMEVMGTPQGVRGVSSV